MAIFIEGFSDSVAWQCHFGAKKNPPPKNDVDNFMLLDKTDIDTFLFWGHHLQLKKGDKLQ